MAEVISNGEAMGNIAPARRRMLKMKVEEKALVLGHFVEEGVAEKNMDALAEALEKVITSMQKDVRLRRSTKRSCPLIT